MLHFMHTLSFLFTLLTDRVLQSRAGNHINRQRKLKSYARVAFLENNPAPNLLMGNSFFSSGWEADSEMKQVKTT